MSTVTKVMKRDGRTVVFSKQKVVEAIFKAAQAVGGDDTTRAHELADLVIAQLENEGDQMPSVEQVQDAVEKVLIEQGHAQTAKAFILYRHEREEERERAQLILGGSRGDEHLAFSTEALKILERRYLAKHEDGSVKESPQQMLLRVANNVARADKLYGADAKQVAQSCKSFYEEMANLRFLPNTPTLMNAGKGSQLLSACFVLPIDDKMESIFGTLRDAAVIHQRGGGTGFGFSRLRPKWDLVGAHSGVAAGAVSFLHVFDTALEQVKQGGVRPGANMAVLRVDHPDILRFIESKREKKSLKNFNISVGATDEFMQAVEEDREYFLRSPRTGKAVGKLRARDVFAVITQNAWKTGDPGLVFLDTINKKHPASHLGEIETTNQCGEAPLLAYESCALGGIDVSKFVKEGEFLWDEFEKTIRVAAHFLDNMIDMNRYPTKKIAEATKRTRKFGLGIMGYADLLFMLSIKYDSEEGLAFGDKLVGFMRKVCYDASKILAEQRGVCPGWEGSVHEKEGRKMRNMTCLALSPTGTRSILAGCSAGCEPVFAISYQKTVLGSNELVSLNKTFERVAKERGFYSPELIHKISLRGGVQQLSDVPQDIRNVFVTAQDIAPEWHVRMQATLQKHVDNSISKTINFSRGASIRDVENAYILAWRLGCKGITIYRDGSYEDQVMTIG